jgi:FKBP-type peptidyl-prolyl cis-trans isomerase FkpA
MYRYQTYHLAAFLLSAVCCVVCLGCSSSRSQSLSQSEPSVPMASKSDLIQASFREEGPDGPAAESDFRQTPSGLKYRVLRQGNGNKPTEYNQVQVSYRGWLDDGSVFDSSYKRGKPISFKLRDVVKGWTEGMQYVSEGGKIELEIPSSLGYGAQGSPPSVPPFATLHFIVELHEVY